MYFVCTWLLLWHLVISTGGINQSEGAFCPSLYWTIHVLVITLQSIIPSSLQQWTSTIVCHKLDVCGIILKHKSVVFCFKECQHWRDKSGIMKRYHICLFVFIYDHAVRQVEREATSPVWYLLPVDAITLIPQMWLQAWHAWLSRWWLTLRQRAWPVLAHSVTSTVPT